MVWQHETKCMINNTSIVYAIQPGTQEKINTSLSIWVKESNSTILILDLIINSYYFKSYFVKPDVETVIEYSCSEC